MKSYFSSWQKAECMLIRSSQHLICHMFHFPSFQGPQSCLSSGRKGRGSENPSAQRFLIKFSFFSLVMAHPLLFNRNEKESPHLLPNENEKKTPRSFGFPSLVCHEKEKKPIATSKGIGTTCGINEWGNVSHRDIVRGSNSKQERWMARDFLSQLEELLWPQTELQSRTLQSTEPDFIQSHQHHLY